MGIESLEGFSQQTLKLICDREEEIKKFNPEEYWTVDVKLKKERSLSLLS